MQNQLIPAFRLLRHITATRSCCRKVNAPKACTLALSRTRSGNSISCLSTTQRALFHRTTIIGTKHDFPSKDSSLDDLLKEIRSDFGGQLKEQKAVSVDADVVPKHGKVNIDEELLRYDYEEFGEEEEPGSEEDEDEEDADEEQISGVSLSRGQTGVFDVEELVKVLKEDNARDVCVIRIPPDINYADYMVIVSGSSVRHLNAMANYVKKLYKCKRTKGDPATCNIEGKQTNWLAIDLGNIVLHLFMPSVREEYDLETLWTVGREFDELSDPANDVQTTFWDPQNNMGSPDPVEEIPTQPSMENVRDWHSTR